MSYPLVPTADRLREVWKSNVERVSGKVPPGNVQEASIMAFLPFNNISRNAIVALATISDSAAVSPIQQLLANMRLCDVFALGVGICKVPLLAGVEQWGNAELTSDPYSPLFTATEQAALRHLYLSKLQFKTNQTDRLDTLHTSEFMIVSTETPANTIKPRLLPASYLMVGGEPNEITLRMPSVGDLTPLANSATRNLYVVVKAMCINIVPASEAQKQEIAAALRGG